MSGSLWVTGAWVVPYAAWMALMSLLPSTALAYGIRTAVTALLLVASCVILRPKWPTAAALGRALAWGLAGGVLVLVVWIAPEQFACLKGWYARWCVLGEGGTTAIAESSALLIAVRFVGSACVISVAEELFFRRWLVGFAGFGWMVALFAIEHDRYAVGAIAGLVYGFLALRKGLLSAIVAHVVTNGLLGLWVLKTGQWQFW